MKLQFYNKPILLYISHKENISHIINNKKVILVYPDKNLKNLYLCKNLYIGVINDEILSYITFKLENI